MITPQLIEYIRAQLGGKVPKDVIIQKLLESGWTASDVHMAFTQVATGTPVATPIVQTVPSGSMLGAKIFLSFGLILFSAFYSFSQYIRDTQQSALIATTLGTQNPDTAAVPSAQPTVIHTSPSTSVKQTAPSSVPAPASTPSSKKTPTSVSTPKPTPVATTPVPAPTPAPKPKGQYTDGTYTGNSADAYYGLIQVQAVISGGKLVDVKILQYPNDRGTSIEINRQALPYLQQEAIAAQSARVDIVSGATDTSQAFQQSLGSALANAKS